MSTLTALKLERELELTRHAMTQRPVLAMRWTIDPRTGRPVAAWREEAPTVVPTAALVSELG